MVSIYYCGLGLDVGESTFCIPHSQEYGDAVAMAEAALQQQTALKWGRAKTWLAFARERCYNQTVRVCPLRGSWKWAHQAIL